MFVVPEIIVDDIRKIRDSNTSDCELDVYKTDIGNVIRFKYLHYNDMVHNHVYFVHYYCNSDRWVRWTIIRQRSSRDEVTLRYIDDNSTASPDKHPKDWYEQIVNAYADPNTYQVSQSFKCCSIVMEDGIRLKE